MDVGGDKKPSARRQDEPPLGVRASVRFVTGAVRLRALSQGF